MHDAFIRILVGVTYSQLQKSSRNTVLHIHTQLRRDLYSYNVYEISHSAGTWRVRSEYEYKLFRLLQYQVRYSYDKQKRKRERDIYCILMSYTVVAEETYSVWGVNGYC